MLVRASAPTSHDPFNLICGDTWELAVNVRDIDGDPVSLDDCSIAWCLDSMDGITQFIALSLDQGIAANAATGEIIVKVPAAQTAQLVAGNYRDWLRVKFSDQSVMTVWTGVIRAAASPAFAPIPDVTLYGLSFKLSDFRNTMMMG